MTLQCLVAGAIVASISTTIVGTFGKNRNDSLGAC